jgi:hypothetical protein
MKMKRLALAILLFTLASPAWATTYFLAPAASGGNDSNNGTSASTPWLTPNHAVNCGDVILAAACTYTDTNFAGGHWGTVTCPAGNNVAWLKCLTFDACKITVSGSFNEMDVTSSYWGVQGWEITATSNTNQCFEAYPPGSTTIHHIIYANNVANGCYDGGFGAGPAGNAGVDYYVIIGNIVYNAAQGSNSCNSGIDLYEPKQSDTAAGTHIYIAGNFTWSNSNPSTCAGGAPTDGEGILIDTPDGSQGGTTPYTQQIVIKSNIVLANGGRGIEVFNNTAGSSHATIYVEYNTVWGNNLDTNDVPGGDCGNIMVSSAQNTTVLNNIAVPTTAATCGTHNNYAFYVSASNGTVAINNNWGNSAFGFNGGSNTSPGFSYGAGNVFGTNPNFSNATTPGAPNCGSSFSVSNCMATVIANFTPKNLAALPYGYQVPSTTQTFDPLFPQWLCNVNLPAGLVTMGCAAQSSLPAPPTNINAKVQ